MACEKCADLCLEYEILTPGHLRKAFAVVRDNIADGTIQETFGTGSYQAFAKALDEGGPWPADHLSCQFACRNCGEVFGLGVDTYHGGGSWAPASAQNKLEDRIIGDAPPLPGDRVTVAQWLTLHQNTFLLTVGLIVLSIVLFVYLRH
jgi:hypothetical protein